MDRRRRSHRLAAARPGRPAAAAVAAAAAAAVGVAALGLAAVPTPAAAAGAVGDSPAADTGAGAEQVTNGGFDDGLAGWSVYPAGSVVDGRGCNDVPAGSPPYSAAIGQSVAVAAGETYELSFELVGEPATEGNVRVVVQTGPDQNYRQIMPARKPAVPGEPQRLAYVFTSDLDYAAAELLFQQDIENPAAYRYCVDEVSLTGGAEPEPYVPDTGPRVRVNQVAYLPEGPKQATLVTDAAEPLSWRLLDDAGGEVARGSTTPRGLDPSAGLDVHTIDFSGVTAPGAGYVLVADGETSHPFDIATDAYEQLRVDALTLFYTNRSGIEISDEIAPGYGRAAGHVGVPPNQGDTAVPCQDLDDDSQLLYDEPWTCEGTRDVSGGWYDAGDHGKYVVNGGISVAQLMSLHERTFHAPSSDLGALGDATLRVPERGNGVPDVLDEARWQLEWLLRMQVPDGQQYAGMANHKVADVDWTGLPLDPAADPQRRVLYRPSTAATLNLAATAAQGARVFAPYDGAFAAELLAAARVAYDAALAEPALHAPAPDPALDPNPGSGPYDDDDVSDERYWAASQLYLTTGEPAYRDDVLASPHHRGEVFTAAGFSWGDVAALARLDLATVPSELPDRERVRASVLDGADQYVDAQLGQPFGQAYDPPGGDYVWGSNSQILNNVVVLATAYDLSGEAAYREAALGSLDYLLGRNALNLSYVTGYGDVDARNQHSRWYANALDPSLPNPPAGSVAGGPNSTAAATGDPVAAELFGDGCAAQFCYVDDIGSWSTNELTVNWNAALAWVASWAADQDDGGPVAFAACEARATVHGRWPGGAVAQLWWTNSGDESVDGWTLGWGATGTSAVTRSWGASIEQAGHRVTASNVSWNGSVRPGEARTLGFLADVPPGAAAWAPERVWLDGAPCRQGPGA